MDSLRHKWRRCNKTLVIGFIAMSFSFIPAFALEFSGRGQDYSITAASQFYEQQELQPEVIKLQAGLDQKLEQERIAKEQQEKLEKEKQEKLAEKQQEKLEKAQQEMAAKVQQKEAAGHESKLISLGEYKITFYCSCAKCCGKSDGITATGTVATEGKTIAVDPRVIALGSKVVIDGKQYIAEDTGGFKGQTIDMFVASHQEALSRGVIRKEVFIESK